MSDKDPRQATRDRIAKILGLIDSVVPPPPKSDPEPEWIAIPVNDNVKKAS